MASTANPHAAPGCVHCFYSGPSGASAVAVNLAVHLADRLPQAAVLYGVPAPCAWYVRALEARGIPWEYVPKDPGPRPGAYLRAAQRLATRAGGAGVVVLHGLQLFPVLAALRLQQHRVTTIGYVHGPTAELRWPAAWRAAGTVAAADHLICVTEELRGLLGRLPLCARRAREAAVVPNGVDLAFWRPDPARRPPETGGVRLCFSGVLTARKRGDLALEMLAALRAQGWGASLAICGDGPERGRLEARARRLGVEGAVEFRGLLDPPELRGILAASHALVHPSRSEGLSMAVLEALACACPVMLAPPPAATRATPRTGGRGDLVSGSGGVVAAGGSDASDGANALGALLGHPVEWARHAEEARRMASERFSLETQVERFMEALDGLRRRGMG